MTRANVRAGSVVGYRPDRGRRMSHACAGAGLARNIFGSRQSGEGRANALRLGLVTWVYAGAEAAVTRRPELVIR